MDGSDLLLLRRNLGLTQEEAREAAGIVNRGFIVEVERNRVRLAAEEYDRMSRAYRDFATRKNTQREGVTA